MAKQDEGKLRFSNLKRMSFANSKNLPRKIKFHSDRKWHFFEFVGIGWINVTNNVGNDTSQYVEVIND